MPIYMTCVGLWCTPLMNVAEETKIVCLAFVLAVGCLLPLLCIRIKIRRGKIRTMAILNRKERNSVYFFGCVCYFAIAFWFRSLNAPFWLGGSYVAAAIASVFAMGINLRWRISAHAISAGGFFGFCAWLGANGLLSVMPMVLVSISIIFLGLICSSRLVLGRHDIWQLISGAALGCAIETGILCIIPQITPVII